MRRLCVESVAVSLLTLTWRDCSVRRVLEMGGLLTWRGGEDGCREVRRRHQTTRLDGLDVLILVRVFTSSRQIWEGLTLVRFGLRAVSCYTLCLQSSSWNYFFFFFLSFTILHCIIVIISIFLTVVFWRICFLIRSLT